MCCWTSCGRRPVSVFFWVWPALHDTTLQDARGVFLRTVEWGSIVWNVRTFPAKPWFASPFCVDGHGAVSEAAGNTLAQVVPVTF